MAANLSHRNPAQWDRIRDTQASGSVVRELLWLSGQDDDPDVYLAAALERICQAISAPAAAVVHGDAGTWTSLATSGAIDDVSAEMLSDVLDRETAGREEGWAAAPLYQRPSTGELLIVAVSSDLQLETVDALAAALGSGLAAVRFNQGHARRVRRLETILDISQQWNRTHEMEPLLVQMAEAATRLLSADRASIFLWDRPNKTLVGRPALGVEDGELRIADNTGIVGQVVQTGETRRVAETDSADEINHQVDSETGYKTRTLLCVPLRSSKGEILGAFELINRLEGNFTDADEQGLLELATHAAVALENTQEREELLTTRRQLSEAAAEEIHLIGESAAIDALRSTVSRVADTELALLILGENGTGKEVVAQSTHYFSRRRDQPFVAINCAAIAETLLESELFGHEKGAFTDAHEARAGKFEMASGGTLFLDEIGDLSLAGQAKLLRVIEEKIVVRVGGSTSIHTDARVIAATNQNLGEMVRDKRFREDLYFRLNVVTIELPPLRDRGDDVLLLADYFLRGFALKAHRSLPKITAAARKRLLSHTWPGNVRELRNLMERLAYLTQGDEIDVDELAFISAPGADGPAAIELDLPLTDASQRFQAEYIQEAIKRCGGNMSEAASRLGLHRSNLYRKMRQLDMATDEE